MAFVPGTFALAQLPSAPVLQNAWAAPGIVAAFDVGGGSGSTVYAGAAGWSPKSGRFQLSGGLGAETASGEGSRFVYGVRAAMPLFQAMGGKLGLAAFAGIGGGPVDSGDTTRSTTVIPAGVAVGYRQSVGSSGKGFSAYVDPMYQHHTGNDGSVGYFRVAGGVDVGISSRFGITLGFESGTGADDGEVGPSSTLWGVGISMKFGR